MGAESLAADLEGLLGAFGVISSQHVHETLLVGGEAHHLPDHIADEAHAIACEMRGRSYLYWGGI